MNSLSKSNGWVRTGSFLKGLLWEGPKEMVKGLIQLTPLEPISKRITEEIVNPQASIQRLKTLEGRKQQAYEDLMMMPGMKIAETAGKIMLHPIRTWNGVEQHYVEAWKSDGGKGKIAFDAMGPLLSFTKLGQLSKFSKLAKAEEIINSVKIKNITKFAEVETELKPVPILNLAKTEDFPRVPFGFRGITAFKELGDFARKTLKQSEWTDSEVFIRGSSVTGKSYLKGEPFDLGRVSDFDLAIVSPKLLERAKSVGIRTYNRGQRTVVLNDGALKKLGLFPLAKELSKMASRDVNLMIYLSEERIALRGEYLKFP